MKKSCVLYLLAVFATARISFSWPIVGGLNLPNEKTTVFMQVGDFFEIYGLVYPDGKEVGNLWKIIERF